MISSNVAGTTKKQLTAAVLFTGYCIGNIIGPQTFLKTEERESPRRSVKHLLTIEAAYQSAYIAMLVGYTVKLLAIIVLYVYMYRVNKIRDASYATDEAAAIDAGMHDLTEIDNKGFRYSL